jgi:hypothetical protein
LPSNMLSCLGHWFGEYGNTLTAFDFRLYDTNASCI